MERLQARGAVKVTKKSRKGRKKNLSRADNPTENRQSNKCPNVENADRPDEDNGLAGQEPAKHSSSSMDEHFENTNPDKELIGDHVEGVQMPQQDLDDLKVHDLAPEEKHTETIGSSADDTGYSSEDDRPTGIKEVDFKVSKLAAAFATNTCVYNLCWLLKFYKSNTASTNHHIVALLQRICDDLELSPMLYQLSLLISFLDILDDKKASACEEYAWIFSFLTNLVRKMLKKMKKLPLLFVEILFWKTHKECRYINAESLSHEILNLKKGTRNWRSIVDEPESESGLFKGTGVLTRRSLADALGEDEIDFPFQRRIDDQTGGDVPAADIDAVNHHREADFLSIDSRRAPRKRRLVFNPEQEESIKNLYQKFKDNLNCSRLIAEALDPEGGISPVVVSATLKQLGLKLPSKRKLIRFDGSQSADSTPETAEIADVIADGSVKIGSSHSRKRVRAFSQMQEAMIKELYEKYKDHKKCSQMIAGELDAGNTYTAAQVSRKLRQLGLLVSKRKRNSSATERFDASEKEVSEEETLVQIMRRRKGKVNDKGRGREGTFTNILPQTDTTLARDDDSSDEVLSTFVKRHKDSNVSTSNEVSKNEGKSNVPGHRLNEQTPIRGGRLGTGLDDLDNSTEDVEMAREDYAANEAAEGSGAGISTPKGRGTLTAALGNVPQLGEEAVGDLEDDIGDSDDDLGLVPRTNLFRRRGKMVLDAEDEEH